MSKLLKISIFITVISLTLFQQICFAFDDGDFQYWNTESISWEVADQWKATLEQEFRFGGDASNPYYRHTDLGATYSGMAKWLDIGLSYRQIFEEKSDDWKYENRPYLNATAKFNLGDFKLSNRARFEYRNREDADNYWRYRNKFSINFPFKLTQLEIQPYVADEIFVSFDKEELDRNRLYSGFSLKLSKNLKGEVFYLWQSSKKDDKWTDYNVLGTKLKLSF